MRDAPTVRHLAVPCVLLAALTTPSPARSQAIDSVIMINITRTARLPANRVVAYVGVDGRAETAVDALVRSTTTMQRVIEALGRARQVQMGRPETHSLGDNPATRGYNPGQLPTTFIARVMVRVAAAGPDTLMRALALAIDAGARDISSLAFESDDADSARSALLREALDTGRKEAEIVARALGGRLGALLGASTSSSTPGFQSSTIVFQGPYGGMSAPTELQTTLNVGLRYRLVR